MELYKPSVEIWEQNNNLDTIMDSIWSHIARCVRVCYQSETKKNPSETDEMFVKRVILSNKPENSEKNHLAMLEHGTVYLYDTSWSISDLEKYKHNIYSKYKSVHIESETIEDGNDVYTDHKYAHYVTTNMRVLVENGWLNDLKYICIPTEYHVRRITVCFRTNIGVSREFNRHRVNSIAEESTRYCNYTKDKFNNSLKFTLPTWLLEEYNLSYIETHQFDNLSGYCEEYLNDNSDINPECWCDTDFYLFALTVSEYCYKMLIKKGWSAQKAREVLPLATKTQLIHTAFVDDWKHFFNLRYKGVSGAPHPNAKILAKELYEQFVKLNYITE